MKLKCVRQLLNLPSAPNSCPITASSKTLTKTNLRSEITYGMQLDLHQTTGRKETRHSSTVTASKPRSTLLCSYTKCGVHSPKVFDTPSLPSSKPFTFPELAFSLTSRNESRKTSRLRQEPMQLKSRVPLPLKLKLSRYFARVLTCNDY